MSTRYRNSYHWQRASRKQGGSVSTFLFFWVLTLILGTAICVIDIGKSNFEESEQCLNCFPPKLNIHILEGENTLLEYFAVLDFLHQRFLCFNNMTCLQHDRMF